MYHGTTPAAINSILNPGDPGKFKKTDGAKGVAAYFSPSIRYIAYPAYSYLTAAMEEGHPVYYQLALEVRVDTSRTHISLHKQNVKKKGCEHPIDAKRDDATFRYIVAVSGPDKMDYVDAQDGVIVTGLMVRKLRIHPKELKESMWIPTHAWDKYDTPKPASAPTKRRTRKRPRSPSPDSSDSEW